MSFYFKLNNIFALLLFIAGFYFCSCQSSQQLMQISTNGVGYLQYYNTQIINCVTPPSICSDYSQNDPICLNGVSVFQNCLAQSCYPVQYYNQYYMFKGNFETFGSFMAACVYNCQQKALNTSANPTWETLRQALKMLVTCYEKYQNSLQSYNYYAFFFSNNWQICSKQVNSCKTDASFKEYDTPIQEYVKSCIDVTPIFITNTAYVSDIAQNQTTTCLLGAFQKYQIDYTNSTCFNSIFNCGGFQILQSVSSLLLQSSLLLFGITTLVVF